MTKQYQIVIEGKHHTIVVSDETEVLLAAKRSGKACVGLWKRDRQQDLSPAAFLVESTEALDQEFLEQAARRNVGLPWVTAKTRRLVIREFQEGDERQIPEEGTDGPADRVFQKTELLKAYIRHQYGFYGYGMWAVVEKEGSRILGKAGVSNLEWEQADIRRDQFRSGHGGRTSGSGERTEAVETMGEGLELGYHIFAPYRRRGYAFEACSAILAWHQRHMDCPLYARTDSSNEASLRLIQKLGFRFIDRKYIGSGKWHDLYGWNC